MKFEFTLYDKQQISKIPVYILEWVTFHVTKHVLINHETEFIDDLLDVENTLIKQIREIQINKFKCKVTNSISDEQPCFKCKFKK